MKIINGRYKIIELINQNRTYSVYEAIDLNRSLSKVNIYILNTIHIENKLLDFCISQYEKISTIQNDSIEILDFGVVINTDSKDKEKNFYYTTNVYKEYKLLLDFVEGVSEEVLVETFLEVCRVTSNQCYEYYKVLPFKEDNIYINSEMKIKLKDRITSILQSREVSVPNYFEDIEEIMNGDVNESKKDIYYINRLLEILINMVLKNKGKYRDNKACKTIMKQIIDDEAEEYKKIFGDNLYSLIYKLCRNQEQYIGSIARVITEVNNLFNMNYECKINNKNENINFNIPLIGRDEEAKSILNSINNILKYHESNNIILVHGEIGIGKTRLLKHIKYIMDTRGNNTNSCFYLQSSKEKSSSIIMKQLLREIVSVSDKSLVSKYKKEIMALLPELYGEIDEEKNEISQIDNKEKFILIARITSFLQEHFSHNPGIIIIDDMSMYDEFTLNIIHYVLNNTVAENNILVVIGYRDGDYLKNYKFIDVLEDIKTKASLDVHLRPLTEDKSTKMLSYMLNVYKISDAFIDVFYKYSMGNPFFIEQALKDLCERKVIYINSETGQWYKLDNHDIYMPANMEEVCASQLKDLDKLSCETLNAMSFFYTPVSIEVLKDVLGRDEEFTDNIVKDLVSKGILYISISDNGFVYTFYNKFLRNYLHKDVEDFQKKKNHKKIVQVLEKYCSTDLYTYIEEIIYHLEILKDKRKLIFYYKENEKRLENMNSLDEAIKCNHKILDLINAFNNKDEFIKDEIKANMNLGKLHNALSGKSVGIEYYLKAKDLCEEQNLSEMCIDIMHEMVWIYDSLGNDKEIYFYTEEIAKILEKVDYLAGKIKYLRIIARNLFSNLEYDKLKEVCNYGISLCKEEHIDFKIAFSNNYCNALIAESNEEEALKLLKKTVKECYDKNYTKPLQRMYNTIGVIYSDYIQHGEEAIAWFSELVDISRINRDRNFEVTALSNLGFSNYVLGDYDKAYKYLDKASNIASEDEFISLNFYNYVYIGSILYKMGKYSECFSYVELCNNYVENNSVSILEMAPYCILLYYYYSLMGENIKAGEYLIKGKQSFDNTNSIIRYKIELLCAINAMVLREDTNIIDEVIDASEKILYIDLRVSMLCEGIFKLINKGFNSGATNLYEYISKFKDQLKCDYNKLALNYIGCILNNAMSVEELEKSLNSYNKVKNPNLMWRIYSEIGYNYYDKGDKANAAVHLSEACDIILNILLQIPKYYRKSFLKDQKPAIKCFELLLQIKSYYNQGSSFEVGAIDIDSTQNIEDLFQIIVESDFINDEFIKSIIKFSPNGLENIDSIEELLNNLGGNNQDTMNIICKYVNNICLSTRVRIIIENNNKFSVVACNDGINELPEDLSIINIARNKGMSIRINRKMINDANGNILSYDVENNIKSAMCIPITQISSNSRGITRYDYTHDILGYIYVESYRKLNNINEGTMNKCLTIGRILYMIIDKLNIKRSSTIDKLTMTLTRKHLEILIHEQIDRSFNINSEFSTIMVDIDKFKGINDTFGHRMGDQVLSKVCQVIIKSIRQDDAVGRYGGEEFIVVLPDTGISEARNIAERIRINIDEAKILGDKRPVTVSLGIANYPNHTTTYEDLIEKSDQALYEAKNSGRNATRVWNESYGSKISTTNKLSGIIVGNDVQDYKIVSMVIEFIDLINEKATMDEKIETMINRIAEIMEAGLCTLFTLNHGNLVNRYSKVMSKGNKNDEVYNYGRIYSTINSGENVCDVDWDNVEFFDDVNKISNIKSNMIVLLKEKSEVIGAIYLTVSINHKEFTYDELNLVNTLGKIMVPILKDM